MGEVIALDRTMSNATGETLAPWAGKWRETAGAAFAARGLPNRRVEAWRYSDLSRALGESAPEATETQAALSLSDVFVARFEDGVLDEGTSILPPCVTPLKSVLANPNSPFAGDLGHVNAQEGHAILALNAAHAEDGLVLHLGKGKALARPLHLRFSWSAGADAPAEGRHVRVLVILEESSSATLVETHAGAPGFATVVTELRLGGNAALHHVRLEQLGAAARQCSVTTGTLAASSRYRSFYLSTGAHFARHEALLALEGPGADAQIDGAYLAADSRHCDNTTVIAHKAPDTTSRQTFRGVLGGRARGVYQGCVKVARDAQRTDARQMSRALLLSRNAEIATKPELEILADDVKCSHGATAGEIDGAALFFLRARGIPEVEARALLVEAYLSEAVAALEDETLRALATGAIQQWLSAHAGEVTHAD